MRYWWVCLFLISNANAQIVYDAYSMSLASSDLCRAQGFYLGRNPATIVDQKATILGCSQIMPFGLSSLGTNTFVFAGRLKNQGYAIEYAQSGLQNYKEHTIGITSGIQLSKNLKLGIKIININIDMADTPIDKKYKVEFGMLEQLGKKLSAGVHLKLRTNKKITFTDNTAINVGWCYLLDPKFTWLFSSEINELGVFSIRSGLEYQVKQNLYTRIGWSNKESLFSTGFTYKIQRLFIETSSAYHNNLGLSYGVGLGYSLSKEVD